MSSDTPTDASNPATASAAWKSKLPSRVRTRPRAYGVGRYGIGKHDDRDDTRYAWTRVAQVVGLLLMLAAPTLAANPYCETADGITSVYGFCKPAVDVEGANAWGDKWNYNLEMFESAFTGVSGSTANAEAVAALGVSTNSLAAGDATTYLRVNGTNGMTGPFTARSSGTFTGAVDAAFFAIQGSTAFWIDSNSDPIIGFGAGTNSISGLNVFVGHWSGHVNHLGGSNTYLGAYADTNHDSGVGFNTVVGENAFAGTGSAAADHGDYNTIFGYNAGSTSTGSYNTFIGQAAGATQPGSGNTYIGSEIANNYNGGPESEESYSLRIGVGNGTQLIHGNGLTGEINLGAFPVVSTFTAAGFYVPRRRTAAQIAAYTPSAADLGGIIMCSDCASAYSICQATGTTVQGLRLGTTGTTECK